MAETSTPEKTPTKAQRKKMKRGKQPKANTGRQYRLYPSDAQAVALRLQGAHCRLIWNIALEQRETAYRFTGSSPKSVDQAKELAEFYRAFPWMKDSAVHALQQTLRTLDQAFANWWNTDTASRRPQYKGRADGVNLHYADCKDWTIRRGHDQAYTVSLPKIGPVEFFHHRPLDGVIRSVTVTESAGHWWVMFGVAEPAQKPLIGPVRPEFEIIGVDRGVTNSIATSRAIDLGDGPAFLHHMPDLLTPGERKRLLVLKRTKATQYQALVRRRKQAGEWVPVSKSFLRTVHAIARYGALEARRRNDWLRKVAHALSAYRNVVFEDLRIRNMVKSAKGTVENPGKNVRQKAGLNRAIHAQGWGNLALYTAEKTNVVKVHAAYSSQECSTCHQLGWRYKEHFYCETCGSKHADINAAKVIEARGARVLAGDSQPRTLGSHSRKAASTSEKQKRKAA